MARNKMEKEFSEKLNQRELQPTPAAWDRLDAMLAAAEAHPQALPVKRNYKWLFIAASFLGFLVVGSLFFSNHESTSIEADPQNSVVERPAVLAPPNAKNAVVEQQTAESAEVSVSRSGESSQSAAAPKIGKSKTALSTVQHYADNTVYSQNHSDPIINQKTNQPDVPQMQLASDASIDELLSNARAKREASGSNVKVNARKLLLEVDSQAEEKLTARQRALRALNRNYQQVKVAVENRNLEENH